MSNTCSEIALLEIREALNEDEVDLYGIQIQCKNEGSKRP
jgi:hypothetical protein